MLSKEKALKRRTAWEIAAQARPAHTRREAVKKLLAAIGHYGTQDVYTNAPEYAGRVKALRLLSDVAELLSQGIARSTEVETKVKRAIVMAKEDEIVNPSAPEGIQ